MKKLLLFCTIVIIYCQAQSQIVNIPDANFKNALVNTICVDTDGDSLFDDDVDTNNDGEIQESEAAAVTWALGVSGEGISSLVGIGSFVNVERFGCSNNIFSTVDLSQNISLISLACGNNYSLENIDLSNNIQLRRLYLNNAGLTSLDLSENVNLERLECVNNQLTNITLPINSNLQDLYCYDNLLTQLDLSQSPHLYELHCDDNQLVNLDLSQNPQLINLTCRNNQLTGLNLANGENGPYEQMDPRNNFNLFCIQVDNVVTSQNRECKKGTFGWCINEWMEYSLDCNLSVDDYTAKNFTVYPNPADDQLTISADELIKDVSVRNFYGQLIFTSEVTALNTVVDMSLYSGGIYFVNVTIGGNILTQKLIVE
jgi:hypothetical protein